MTYTHATLGIGKRAVTRGFKTGILSTGFTFMLAPSVCMGTRPPAILFNTWYFIALVLNSKYVPALGDYC